MSHARSYIAAGLVALTLMGTTLTAPTEADAHPLLIVGLAAGAVGVLAGAAVAHATPANVIVERGRGPNCFIKERVGRWGRVHDVEVCR
jgi:hypothetical protein